MSFPRVIRRRVAPADGGVPQTFDGEVSASLDDGHSFSDGGFNATATSIIIGKSTNTSDGFARILNVTVPAGATIDDAYLSAISSWSGQDGAGTKTNIYMEDADNPAAPTTRADHSGRSRTSNFIAWDDYDFPDTSNYYDSPSFTAAVQDVVDRGGWASGQAMQILWDDDGSTNLFRYWIRSYDHPSGEPIKLHIEFTA